MADWKYIAYDIAYGRRVPIIFPDIFNHVDVARRLNPLASNGGRQSAPVVSAGFIAGLAVTSVYGQSESLDGLKCDDLDTEVINTMPVQHGLTDALMPGMESLILMKHVEKIMDYLRKQV